MAILQKKDTYQRPQIDLTGPNGNAISLIGTAIRIAEQLRWSKKDIQALQEDMMSSDYTHVLRVFDSHFGQYVDLLMADPEDHKEEVSKRWTEEVAEKMIPELKDLDTTALS